MRPRAKWTRTKCRINPTVGLGLACTFSGLVLLVSKALRTQERRWEYRWQYQGNYCDLYLTNVATRVHFLWGKQTPIGMVDWEQWNCERPVLMGLTQSKIILFPAVHSKFQDSSSRRVRFFVSFLSFYVMFDSRKIWGKMQMKENRDEK